VDWKDIWVEKYRPKTLDDIILPNGLRDFLTGIKEDSKETGGLPNLMFSGPAGCGKSSLAHIIAKDVLDCQYLYINGSEETSIEVVRTKIIGFAQTKSIDGKIKLIILDEAEGLSGSTTAGRSSAQQALRNVIEEYSDNTRFIFTTNYPDKIIEPIHSRVLEYKFNITAKECLKQGLKVLKAEGVKVPKDQVEPLQKLVNRLAPDLRNILIQLQKSSVDGVLNIEADGSADSKKLCNVILNAVVKGGDLLKLRENLIKMEDTHNIDYHDLLKGLYNCILTDFDGLNTKQKIQMSLIVSDSIVDHFVVSDKEINFSACVFKMSQAVT